MTDVATRYGATEDEWDFFSIVLNLTSEMLPVVSNPFARISPTSTMKLLGKTPSIIKADGTVVGLASWTERITTDGDIKRWKPVIDYGFCLQARHLRPLDVDVKDPALAQRVKAFIKERYTFPIRWRHNSSKFLMAFYVEGEIPKTVLKLDHQAKGGEQIELLGNGQQFVACGAHIDKDGVSRDRYEWDWQGLEDFPTLTIAQYTELCDDLAKEFAVEQTVVAGGLRKAKVSGATVVDDPVASFLLDNDLVLDEGREGALHIDCPWKDGHSSDSGPSQTSYFPKGGRGYQQGHFKCLHASCSARTDGDFLEAFGVNDDLFEPLPPAVIEPGELVRPPVIKNDRDWNAIARQVIETNFSWDGLPGVRYHQQEWLAFDGKCYQRKEAGGVDALVRSYLEKAMTISVKVNKKTKEETKKVVPFLPNRSKVGEVVAALQGITFTPKSNLPFWDDDAKKATNYIALDDGLLNVTTRKLEPHTPKFVSTTALPFAWAKSAGEPQEWNTFLKSLWGDDVESIELLRMIFGYLLMPDTSQQKMFLIKGPPRSGKGTIVRILQALLGERNTVSTSFAQLAATPFGLESLIGKNVAFLPEARNTGGRHVNMQVAVERMLSISGEDDVSVERKGQKAWTGRLSTRFFMVGNELPALGDSSEAFASRFVILETTVSYLGHEDKSLTDRLMRELPQIMRWAVEGYDLLTRNGCFVVPESTKALIEKLADDNNHVRQFVKDACALEASFEVEVAELYSAYRFWCSENGRYAEPRNLFLKSLENASYGIKHVDTKREGRRVFLLKGLRVDNCKFESLGG